MHVADLRRYPVRALYIKEKMILQPRSHTRGPSTGAQPPLVELPSVTTLTPYVIYIFTPTPTHMHTKTHVAR